MMNANIQSIVPLIFSRLKMTSYHDVNTMSARYSAAGDEKTQKRKLGVAIFVLFLLTRNLAIRRKFTFRSQLGTRDDQRIQLFRQRLSHKRVKAYATMPIGTMGTKL